MTFEPGQSILIDTADSAVLTVAGQIVQTSDYYGRYRTYSFVVTQDTVVEAFFDVVPASQLIYDDATGRLICADTGGGLLYHDEVVYNH